MNAFKHIPFLRICIPFIGGIIFALQLGFANLHWMISLIILLGALTCLLLRQQSSVIKIAFLLCCDIFFFCFGINLVNNCKITNNSDYYARQIIPADLNKLVVAVNDLPVLKERSVKCELKVLAVKSKSGYEPAKGKIIGYFKRSKAASEISFGQVLIINSQLLEIEIPKNPYEFNYKNYLANRQIHHITFVDSGSFALTSIPSDLSPVWLAGLKIKQHILSSLNIGGLTQDAYSISSALLTGYDDEIDSSVMEAFSHTGTLHVLSVSGLHTGLIYLVLAFLFDLVDKRKKHKLGKFIFITICLWLFALITGFSAPVLRAVIMFNLLGFGRIFFRNDHRNLVNILLVSAFVLLCYDPFLIQDIGFLLSYFAMFGIIFYQPVFAKIWQPESRYAVKIRESLSASFAATLTTLPFTLFFFKQFPLWFFICNLVVVPATFAVLLLALLVVLKVTKAAVVINLLIKFLIGFINLFNIKNVGYIDNIHFEWVDAFILSVLLVIISVAFYYRSYKYLVYSFLLIIFWQINGIFVSFFAKERSMVTVYHVNRQNVLSVKNNQEVILNSLNPSDFNYHVKPQLVSFNYPNIQIKSFNYIIGEKEKILTLNKKNFWPQLDYSNITTLVVANNIRLKKNDLEKFTKLNVLVADGSNNTYVIKQLAELCSKFGIRFYSTKASGAYIGEL